MDIFVLEKCDALVVLEPQVFVGFLSLNRFRLLHTLLLINYLNPNNMDLDHIPLY